MEQAPLGTASTYSGQEARRSDRFSGSVPLQHNVAPFAVVVAAALRVCADGAFRFLCAKGVGGDFLVLRTAGDDDYNDYIKGLCEANSVATLIIPDRAAAHDPKVADIIRHAEAVFIAGGDQSRYINWWQGTQVQEALNAHIADGKLMGGTSAGLAVLGDSSTRRRATRPMTMT